MPALLLLAACSRGSATPRPATPTVALSPSASTTAATAVATRAPVPLAAQIGVRAALPPDDPIDLAARYGLTRGRAPIANAPSPPPTVGSTRTFNVVRLSALALEGGAPPQQVTVQATLLATSAHAYFYADTTLGVTATAAQEGATRFESNVWPTVTGVFGLPPTPGVDGDPRIIVLQADLGGGAGGYVTNDDLYLKAVRPLSNEAEMIYMDRSLPVESASFSVVLAHELQHLVHAQDDRYEEAWVNEGLSDVALGLAGGAVSSVRSFEARPDTPLTDWESGSLAHYGASAAFFRYLAGRFGGDAALGAIAREPGHGTAGVEQFLASTGQSLTFRDVFADWLAANILDLPSGPYGNPGHPVHPAVQHTLAAGASADGSARQFGADYYTLTRLGGGDHVLRFQGRAHSPVLPAPPPPDGGPAFWGNAEDSIDTKLTRPLDLTGAPDPVLTFRTWYDIERWYDWGYVSVSTDGGATWQALEGDHTTSDDPVRAAYGPGYTGRSGGGATAAWVDERVSLAKYAGQKVLLRFEYVTDGATHGPGWAVADVAVTGTGFADPALTDAGWSSAGWVRIDQQLPQTYVVRLIEERGGGSPTVLDVPLDTSGGGELRFSAAGVTAATLVVAGTTEGTTVTAPYRVTLAAP